MLVTMTIKEFESGTIIWLAKFCAFIFCFFENESSQKLDDIARLDTLVTVVDAKNFLAEIDDADYLRRLLKESSRSYTGIQKSASPMNVASASVGGTAWSLVLAENTLWW